MFDIGFWEILLIGVLALVVLGPERLPGAMRSTLKTIRSVRNVASGFKEEVEHQLRVHELHENLKKAEQQGLKDLSPELKNSVDELKEAAESVQKPYKKP
ncbi:MAG: Sec-independent protein translocase protein TatB [Pseudomonadota bacterium]|jgi:sec-independent protein translocase protein TatB|uniref:Sec-independent protein translocase protein TatB n=1 Tax=Alteromonas oceani TaxID=2071609 RepID=A0ABV7JY45_9ALTE|nr:Sec-independent protein translocase protein TatB [Alteromonas oceani]MAJ69856.1 twin-arginine translocase subunit TatB [Alteromonadaceae bacterium]MBR9791848.1 Sec-independent protein translocase subunit TatB [Gammaproteobacteria bacterium]MCP4864023.1 Sec-independent protein translocase subunit TatB [Alteromonas sp.]MDG6096747.1 Sec-independent protein translocase subunit TatB [Alteromonas sp. ZYF713]MDY6925767.1 Sec-independent protein translocase protein TatB [Pseudomonadota bacterium]R|tara:strand:+ start:40326 stop:40625 length:300 start_codon:yes stop_codon:yes gene_type:complete